MRLGLHFSKPLFSSWSIAENDSFACIKPLTYMNSSGEIFSRNPHFKPGDNQKIIVICDNMDLAPGELRLKQKGGTAGHNGLKSIVSNIGTDFWPLYVGVGRPAIGADVISHVLGKPEDEELIRLSRAVERCVDAIISLRENSIEEVMNELNKRQSTIT